MNPSCGVEVRLSSGAGIESASSARPTPVIRWDDSGRAVARSDGGDESRFVGDDDELGAVAGAELGEDAAHVGLDRREADMQPVGDLGVGEALRDERQHFALTLGEQIDVSASVLPADDHGD